LAQFVHFTEAAVINSR